MTAIRARLLASCFACVLSATDPVGIRALDDPPLLSAQDLLEQLSSSRTAIDSCHVRYTVTIYECRDDASLAGCACSFSGWHDFKNERFRIDSDRKCPGNVDASRNTRFSYRDKHYLIVPDDNTVGTELEGKALDYLRSPESLSIHHLSTDVRMVGTFPVSYEAIKNYSLTDLLGLLSTCESPKVSAEELDNRTMTKLVLHRYLGADCTMTYWFDALSGGMPVRIKAEAKTASGPLVHELEAKWIPVHESSRADRKHWMPQEVDVKQWDDGKLSTHDRFVLDGCDVGVNIPDALFSWQSFALPDDFVVMTISKATKSMKQWNARSQSFGEWKPRTFHGVRMHDLPAPARDSPENGRIWLIVANVAVGASILLWLVVRRIRASVRRQ